MLIWCSLRRAGAERWSKRKERIFFEELAATANITRAAEAAGVSTNAVHARRLKHRLFAAKWAAVAASAKASIHMHLLEETQKSFDPANLETGDVKPRVTIESHSPADCAVAISPLTIDQAIKISQMGAAKKEPDELSDPFAEQGASMSEEGADKLRDSIFGKLQRLRERDRRDQLEAGWSYDESYDLMIPPGYVQGPDYKPKPPEPDFEARYQ